MKLDVEKMKKIFELTLQRLNIPVDNEGASLEQALQVAYMRELNSFVALGVLMCGEEKFLEVTRAYLDMIELMVKEA